MRLVLHRTLSTLAVAGALALTSGGLGAAVAALDAKPLRAEVAPGSSTDGVTAKPLRAETTPDSASGLVLAKPLRAESTGG